MKCVNTSVPREPTPHTDPDRLEPGLGLKFRRNRPLVDTLRARPHLKECLEFLWGVHVRLFFPIVLLPEQAPCLPGASIPSCSASIKDLVVI